VADLVERKTWRMAGRSGRHQVVRARARQWLAERSLDDGEQPIEIHKGGACLRHERGLAQSE